MNTTLSFMSAHRVTGEHTAHVVEILCAIATSVADRGAVEIASSFEPPRPDERVAA